MLSDCPIPGAKGFATIEGTGVNGVLILGESLHAEKDLSPESMAGAVLSRAIRKLGYTREAFLLWPAIPTCPPENRLDRAWYPEARAWGRWHLEQVVRKYRPRAILALGDLAFQMSTSLIGDSLEIKLVEGYTWPSPLGVTVVPSFHPAFLRRGAMTHFGCLLRDIGLAIEVAREGRPPAIAPSSMPIFYEPHPTEKQAWEFFGVAATLIAGPSPSERVAIAYDIETPYSKRATEEEAEEDADVAAPILSIQFSLAPGSGIFMPWRDPYIEIAKKLLALPNDKMGWNNWRFDDPRLRSNGVVINGRNHDLMWAWHHLQPDLPRGIQFAAKFLGWLYPWKHLAHSRPEFYGIVDCDVLQTIGPRLFKSLKDAGIYRGYERHILGLEPILQKMAARGMPVDPKRYAEVEFELGCRMDGGFEELQELVPIECKTIKTFKKKPPQIMPWKPSIQGLTKYTLHKGYDLPRDFKTGKTTFDQLHLQRLYGKTKDPLFKAILDYKDAATVLTNHISNWRPTDGRVHSTFYYTPATGQLSSKRPNIQNAPKHKDGQGDIFRSIIRAEPGKTLLEFDFKGFHALMMGFEARDLDFIRLVRIDIHSFVTSHFLKLPGHEKAISLPDAELALYLARVKKEHKHVRDYQVKHAVLGYNNGMGWKKLYNQYKEFFSSQAEAKRVNDMMDALFPTTAKFRQDIRIKAHEQGCLVSRHGYIRRFWEVAKWTPEGMVPGGEQSEQAVSFLSSNDAFGEIKDRLITLDAAGYLDKFGFINTIHDSLLFECPDNLVEECIPTVWSIMEAPSTVLIDPIVAPKGLVCEVSASIGKSWNKMEDLKRPCLNA